MSFDQALFQVIFGLAHRSALLDFLGIFLAKYLPYALFAVFFIWLFFERNWKLRFYAFAFPALAAILARGIGVELIRFLYYRPRPALVLAIDPLIATPVASSFPSGHATMFFALAAAMFFLNRWLGIWFLAAAVLVGLGRIFVGVHWPSDIIAGALLGVICALAIHRLLPAKNFTKL